MPYSYSLFNKRENIFQPNFTRNRQPYSGPISSEMLNLHNDQLILDAARLAKNIDNIELKIQEINSLIEVDLDSATPGYYINGDIDMTIYGQKVIYDREEDEYVVSELELFNEDYLQYYKPLVVSSKVSMLMSKLDNIEKNINI